MLSMLQSEHSTQSAIVASETIVSQEDMFTDRLRQGTHSLLVTTSYNMGCWDGQYLYNNHCATRGLRSLVILQQLLCSTEFTFVSSFDVCLSAIYLLQPGLFYAALIKFVIWVMIIIGWDPQIRMVPSRMNHLQSRYVY